MTSTTFTRRELAHRVTNGLVVALYWDKVGDTLALEVYDPTTEEYFELDVPRDRAMDAFHHPYAYLAAAESSSAPETLAA
jgi:hypothetical protein